VGTSGGELRGFADVNGRKFRLQMPSVTHVDSFRRPLFQVRVTLSLGRVTCDV